MFTATPDQVQIGFSILTIVLMLHVFLGACAYSIMLERKLSAWMRIAWDRTAWARRGCSSRSPMG